MHARSILAALLTHTALSLLALGACGGKTVSDTSGQGGGSTSGSGSGNDTSAAALCTSTGGTVVQTYCSANPPFTVFTCEALGTNEGFCDPAPGEGAPSTPECECPSASTCFDPDKGCIDVPASSGGDSSDGSGSGSGSFEGSGSGSGSFEGSGSGSFEGSGSGSSATSEGSGSGSGTTFDAGATTDSVAAMLCMETGGNVVQTFCSANPPFAQYTCASGENGAICDPGPGEQDPTTPECVCPGGENGCFDPDQGCVTM